MSTHRLHHALRRLLAALALSFVLPALAGTASARAEAPPPEGVVNINSAKAEELMLLPRIGEEKARRIIEFRAKTPFKSVNELARVKGIGLRSLRVLKPYLRVEGPTTLTSEVRVAKPTDEVLDVESPRPPARAPVGSRGR